MLYSDMGTESDFSFFSCRTLVCRAAKEEQEVSKKNLVCNWSAFVNGIKKTDGTKAASSIRFAL